MPHRSKPARPRVEHIVIVGSGFAGLCAAIELRKRGFEDFTIYEKASRVGGTWRDNDYPGAACDVPSYLYSFSFEPKHDWTRAFACQSEILAYLEACVEKYDLRRHLRLGVAVTSATYDETSGTWSVEVTGGASVEARALIVGTGGLSRPMTPALLGLERFRGKVVHSARWDHGYPLEGKRVAVIGTGASAIQIVPSIVDRVDRLSVFQRTPPWILPKPDREIAPEENARTRRFPRIQRLYRFALYWQHEARALGFTVHPKAMKLVEVFARRYLAASVRDPEIRAKLTPDYVIGCKRILISNDYYSAVQRAHAEVVTEGIREIVADGIVDHGGRHRPFDAIVLATGFHAAEAGAPFPIRGEHGVDLDASWTGGPEAYLGTAVAGFPNLFLLVGPNTGLGHNSMIYMIESQVALVVACAEKLWEGKKAVRVRPDVQTAFNRKLHARLGSAVWATGCNAWYRTATGKNTTLWPGFTFEFRRLTRRFSEDAFELIDESVPTAAADGAPHAAPRQGRVVPGPETDVEASSGE